MTNNIDLIILSTIIVTCFVILSIKLYKILSNPDENSYDKKLKNLRYLFKELLLIESTKKKNKPEKLSREELRKAISNTLADMESDGVYFDREIKKKPASDNYTDKFKAKMNKKS